MTFVWFCRTSAISRATDEEWVLWRWRTFRSLSLFQPEALFLEFLIENNIVFSSKENTETIFFDFQNLTKSNCIISIEKHFIAPIKLCSSGKQLQPNTIYCANVVSPVNGWDWNVVNNAAFRVTILKENHKVTIKAKVMGWQKRLLGIMLCFFSLSLCFTWCCCCNASVLFFHKFMDISYNNCRKALVATARRKCARSRSIAFVVCNCRLRTKFLRHAWSFISVLCVFVCWLHFISLFAVECYYPLLLHLLVSCHTVNSFLYFSLSLFPFFALVYCWF